MRWSQVTETALSCIVNAAGYVRVGRRHHDFETHAFVYDSDGSSILHPLFVACVHTSLTVAVVPCVSLLCRLGRGFGRGLSASFLATVETMNWHKHHFGT